MDAKEQFLLKTEEKTEEKNRYFFALIFVGGFFGALTFCLRGGVFCNAQTGNVLLASVSLALGNFQGFWTYFWSIVAYIIGVVAATALSRLLQKRQALWYPLLLCLEMVATVVLGFIPDSAPYRISQMLVNGTMAMQFTTFRTVRGEVMASTFCTNHLRQMASALTLWIIPPHEKRERNAFLQHFAMISFFALGVAASALLGTALGGKSIWFALIPLGYVLLSLLFSQKRAKKARKVDQA